MAVIANFGAQVGDRFAPVELGDDSAGRGDGHDGVRAKLESDWLTGDGAGRLGDGWSADYEGKEQGVGGAPGVQGVSIDGIAVLGGPEGEAEADQAAVFVPVGAGLGAQEPVNLAFGSAGECREFVHTYRPASGEQAHQVGEGLDPFHAGYEVGVAAGAGFGHAPLPYAGGSFYVCGVSWMASRSGQSRRLGDLRQVATSWRSESHMAVRSAILCSSCVIFSVASAFAVSQLWGPPAAR